MARVIPQATPSTGNRARPGDTSGDGSGDSSHGTGDGSSDTGTPVVTPIVTPIVVVDPIEGFHLVFVTGTPTSGIAGKNLNSKVVVYAEDAAGHIIKNANTLVTLSVPGSTLGGKTSHNLRHGKAVFSGLAIESAGTWTITATDDIYTSAVSDAITVTTPPHHTNTAAIRRHHA